MFSYSRLEAYVLIVSLCLFNLFFPLNSCYLSRRVNPDRSKSKGRIDEHTLTHGADDRVE